MKTFAERLRKAREAAGFTSAQQFAHRLQMEPHAYRKYERGESEPNFQTLVLMCEELGVTPNDLITAPSETLARKKKPGSSHSVAA